MTEAPAPKTVAGDIIVGLWQVSRGHAADRPPDEAQLLRDLSAFVDAGFTTFDCADIYQGVEALLGRLRRHLGDAAKLRVHTKFVPDRDALPGMQREYVEGIIDRSLRRLGVEQLDLVQYYWWDYDVPGYLDAAGWLVELQREGKINQIGATNFDVALLREFAAAGFPMAADQVQYSVLDRRPEAGLSAWADAHQMSIYCYGTIAGGFLSERWLGAQDPTPDFATRSLQKYRLIIDEFGGWAAFQRLLVALREVAQRHGSEIATVATRWVLDRPGVSAAIVGARDARHLESLCSLRSLYLDESDHRTIAAVLRDHAGPPGDVFSLERIPAGPHAAIMKTGLNRDTA